MFNHYQDLSKFEKRAFWIMAIMAIIFAIFSSTLMDTLLGAPNFQYFVANALPFLLTSVAVISALTFLAGKAEFGSWFIQLGTISSLLLVVTQAEGYSFPSAFIILAVTVYIPFQTLKERPAYVSLWIGVGASMTALLLGEFWTGFRIPALAEDVLFAAILAVILAIILFATTLAQFSTYTIRNKLMILGLGVGLISILPVAVLTTISTQQALTEETRRALVASAKHIVTEIDSFLEYNINSISAEAQLPEVTAYLNKTPQAQATSRESLLALFNTLAQRDPENIGSYALLNSEGVVVADTFVEDIGKNKSEEDYFLQTRRTGRAFVTPIRYITGSPDPVFHIGVPVQDQSGKFIGVLSVRFYSSLLSDIVKSNNGFAGEDSYGILLDEYNLILAHGTNPDWISRTPIQPDINAFSRFQLENRISAVSRDEISLNMPDFSQKLGSITPDAPYFSSTDEAWNGPVEVGIARSSKTVFLKVAYVQPQAIALISVNRQAQIVIVVSLATLLLIIFSSFFASRAITQPIVNLAKIAEDISSGNLNARAQYHVQDEVGALANSFNHMTSQLQDTLGGLERRVAERTADLDTARLLSERRAHELQSISEISRAISTEQKLEILLPLITRLVSEGFNFYHVGIFFVDGTRRFAFLQAANSEGGQKMLARGHRLEVGTGLVGTVAQTGKHRIALDVGADAVFFENPDLPDTHSEMALPLNIRGRTIGVMDVQSTKTGAFTDADAYTLSILADQIAIAIETARSFGQTQQAREEAEALYAQVIRQEWGSFSQQETKIGYRQTATGGRPISKLVETEEIRQARENGQTVVTDGKETRSHASISIPVKLHGQVIGILNIKAPSPNRRWNQDEINLAQAVSDRLALALDNVRLLQESQRRAAKETKIGEVSSKIGASINMRNVLQTAVEELGRALPGSEVVIQFQSSQEN